MTMDRYLTLFYGLEDLLLDPASGSPTLIACPEPEPILLRKNSINQQLLLVSYSTESNYNRHANVIRNSPSMDDHDSLLADALGVLAVDLAASNGLHGQI